MSSVLPSLRVVTPQRRAVLSSRERLLRLLGATRKQRIQRRLINPQPLPENQAVVVDCRDLHPSKSHA